MTSITIPYHLFIPSLISVILLLLIVIRRRRIFNNSKRKSFWISIVVFLIIYAINVGGAMITDIKIELELNSYDLNKDGFFSNNEVTPEQQAAYQKLINDVGRNFSVFTGLIFTALISLFVFFIGLGFEKYRKLKLEEKL